MRACHFEGAALPGRARRKGPFVAGWKPDLGLVAKDLMRDVLGRVFVSDPEATNSRRARQPASACGTSAVGPDLQAGELASTGESLGPVPSLSFRGRALRCRSACQKHCAAIGPFHQRVGAARRRRARGFHRIDRPGGSERHEVPILPGLCEGLLVDPADARCRYWRSQDGTEAPW